MNKQSGFTLVEIAIVLVIIGLLLGGVMKGQELINSAKVKNLAQDFKQVPIFILGYQDKFKKLPGDDKNADANVGAAATNVGNGTGIIDGNWNDIARQDSVLFWEHIRLAKLATGSTIFTSATDNSASLPTNAEGGRLGIQGLPPIKNASANLSGAYFICSTGINGKLAKQIDLTLDDGNGASGSMMAVQASVDTSPSIATTPAPVTAEAYDDSKSYTVCMGV